MAEDPLVDAVDNATDEDRITLGQRIAGIKQPSYMPTTPTGETAAAPDVRPPVTFDPNSIPESVRPRQLTPSEVAAPATGAQNPNLQALSKKQAALSTPINPMDPATGKVKPQYKMGLGQRILGTISAFGQGFSGHQYTGPNLGRGATNWRYGREEAQRQGELEGVNTQIKTQEQMDTENEKLYRDAIKQAYEGQLGEARVATSKAQQDRADTAQQLADLKSKQGPPNKIADESAERTQVADKMGLKGEERKTYILTGKLPKETERQPTELETWMSAFKRDNGRAPTADEIANRKANKPPTRADFDKVEQRKAKALKDAETAYNKATAQLLPNDTEGRQQALAELNTAKDNAQQAYQDEIQTLNDRVPAGQAKGKSQSSSQPQQAPAKPTDPAPAGRVWVYNKKTGARGTIPQNQLKQATQGPKAQYGTW